jgi:hypothetical protein
MAQASGSFFMHATLKTKGADMKKAAPKSGFFCS